MAEHELKYMSSERMYEGIIIEVHGGSVVIDLKGRLGQLRIPKRMIISDYDLEVRTRSWIFDVLSGSV